MSLFDRVRPGLRALSPYHVPPLPCAVKIDANESPYPPDPELLEALGEAIRGAHLERYPDPNATRLRALVAADLGQPASRLVFGNGSDDLIGLLCQTFAAPQHDGRAGTVVVAWPSFVVYRTAVLAAGMEFVEAPLGPRFEADPAALDRAIAAANPNLVFVATPNNPTGTRWSRAAIEALVFGHPDTLIVVDEAYAMYVGESFLDLLERAPNLMVLRTYSKVGLAALRLGVLVASEALAHEVEKVRPPYNLGLLPQLAGELALGPFHARLEAHVAEVVRERERLFAALRQMDGLEVFDSSANLIMVRVADAGRLWQRLIDRQVLVRNLDRPGPLAGCLRITVGTPAENDRLLAVLPDALDQRPG